MQVTHVLIGKSEPVDAKSGRSGINKQPQPNPIKTDIFGLENDAIVDTDNHGGRDQAVYIFGGSDYVFWNRQLECDLPPGTFGENLIIDDLSTHDVKQGDLFLIGNVTLRVTFPRIPCVTLAKRMDDAKFPKAFTRSGHVGVYCAVEKTGLLAPGPVTWTQNSGAPILDLLPGFG